MNHNQHDASPARTKLLLAGILILAAILRVGWPGITEFKYDEASMARRALTLVHDGVWPTAVISSIESLPHPPLMAYLLAVPFSVTRNPAVASAFLGALGVVGVWLTYEFGRRYFDVRVGLIAAALFALSPWAVFYSRKIWTQVIPAVTLLFMLGLYAVIVRGRERGLAAALTALGGLVGTHLGAAIYGVVLALGLVLHPRRVRDMVARGRGRSTALWAGVGMVGLVALMSPYLVGAIRQLSQAGGTDEWLSVAQTEGESEPYTISTEPAYFTALIATGYQFHALAGNRFEEFYASLPIPPQVSVLDVSELILIFVGMAYIVVRAIVLAVRNPAQADAAAAPPAARYALMALWIVLPLAMWTFLPLSRYPHHHIQSYPVQHLALAVFVVEAIDWLGARRARLKPILTGVMALWVGLLGVWQVTQYLGMLNFVSREQIVGGHGQPVRALWAAAEQARALAGGDDLPVVIHTIGDDPRFEGGAAEFDAVLGDLDLILIEDPALEVIPSTDYIRIVDHQDGTYTVERLSPAPAPEQEVVARLANGLDLLGVETSEGAGNGLIVRLTWGIRDAALATGDYGYSVQLYDAGDERVGQVDAPFLRAEFWRTGDRVVVEVTILASGDLGGGSLIAAVYQYAAEGFQGVDVLDIAGNPAGQQVVIPLGE